MGRIRYSRSSFVQIRKVNRAYEIYQIVIVKSFDIFLSSKLYLVKHKTMVSIWNNKRHCLHLGCIPLHLPDGKHILVAAPIK